METPHHILLGVGFGESLRDTLDETAFLARVFDAEITLAHAVPYEALDVQEPIMDLVCARIREVRSELKNMGLRVNPDTSVEYGRPDSVILAAADTVDASLVVIGARQKKESGIFALGNTAEKVIRRSRHPVWVVHPSSRPQTMRKVLCTVDFSPLSDYVLAAGAHLARLFRAELTILHVLQVDALYPNVPDFGGRVRDHRQAMESIEVKLKRLVDSVDLGGILVTPRLGLGSPSAEIVKVAADLKVDLIAMGSAGRTGLRRVLLGSTAERVVRQVPSSMVVIKGRDTLPLGIESELVDAETHYRRGKELSAKGFYDEALRQLGLSLAIDPFCHAAYETQAEIFEKIGKKDLAKGARDHGRSVRGAAGKG